MLVTCGWIVDNMQLFDIQIFIKNKFIFTCEDLSRFNFKTIAKKPIFQASQSL